MEDQKIDCSENSSILSDMGGAKGFVCHYRFEEGSSQFIFLDVDQETGGVSINNALSFSTSSYLQTISSANGLLLLSGFGSGLAFDGKQYQVVLVHVFKDEENGLGPLPGDACGNLRGEFATPTLIFDGVHTWNLLEKCEHAVYSHSNVYDREKHRWALVYTIDHTGLAKQDPDILCPGNQWGPHNISPFAYVEDSETMYLQLPGIVVAHNTKTRGLQKVCGYEFPDMDFQLLFFLPLHPKQRAPPEESK
ncbi:hypothetical protein OIU74_012613 [Salix koriyanagi]|uniref:Uncharacterized protein n=1 Tax=Salix koriyanagi TaxID=2511006 RepID=A0A9Q0Q7H7_9ROSI|nr:hypothetical protein OIU74_012613 [Salix koriyanagi]